MEHEPRILSVREHPEYARQAIEYISSRWREVPQALYDDCISESLYAVGPLPQWYLLLDSERIVGCARLISNDFISRGDLWPWVCALYVEETFRERGYAGLLLERCRRDAERSGYRALYLSTELEGYYEKHGYDYIGEGYGPDGGAILIYRFDIRASALLASGGYVVRPERPGEEEELCRLVRTAFETATVSDGTEQDFAARLRNSKDYIPELALVATCKERPVAHVMFTRTRVERPNGQLFEGLLVAPLSVLAAHRGIGLGAALLEEGMRRARVMGFGAAFLCGNPAYYHRFGFRSTARYGIRPTGDIPPQFVMAAELRPRALQGITGTVSFC